MMMKSISSCEKLSCPGVPLHGPGRQRERLPCFWLSGGGAVLPAFGDFTGLADVSPTEGDRVFVIAGTEVVEPARQPLDKPRLRPR